MNSLFNLDGHVVVITGAAGLLGVQHAEAVASFGGIPVLLDLNEECISKRANNLSARYKVDASAWEVNITDEEALKENCSQIVQRYGKVDALVNNAANNPKVEDVSGKNFSRLENFPVEVWEQDIAVGLTGAFLCAKIYGSEIATNSEGGSIVNISSDLGLIAPDQRLYRQHGVPDNEQPVKPITYSVIKTGIIGLTRYISTYWADKNVRCNTLCPGGVENKQPKEFLQEVCSRIPMGRLANPDEYQGVLVFLLSKASSYMNGAVISVDGGRSVW